MERQMSLDAILSFENRYRADHQQEHALLVDARGQMVVQRDGGVDSVEFDTAELESARGGLMTHTHPKDLPPSPADLAMAAEYQLTLRAVGNAPETGEQFDYTVNLSRVNAQGIKRAFEDAQEQAERELAHKPYGDLRWQRESRHLALRRLADAYGFFYERKMHAVLSESRRQQSRLGNLSHTEQVMRQQVFAPLSAQLVNSLTRLSVQGRVPMAAHEQVMRDVATFTQRAMLGQPDQQGVLAAYSIQRGEIVPRSPYFTALWGLMREAATQAVQYHATMMRQYLDADMVRLFGMATISPHEAMHEAVDPLSPWVGVDGKQLSDRIWVAAGDMRRKLAGYLSNAIASGKSVPTIAAELENYLVKGKSGGFGNLSYEAMRLARTEVAYAYARADSAAAQQNPFVESYSFFTSPKHQCCDICDTVEANSPYPKDDVEHLPPQHPECICSVLWNLVKAPLAVAKALKQKVMDAISRGVQSVVDVIGPLHRQFVDMLFRRMR